MEGGLVKGAGITTEGEELEPDSGSVGVLAQTDAGGLDFVWGADCFISGLLIGAVFRLVDKPNVVTILGRATGAAGIGLVEVMNGGYFGPDLLFESWLGSGTVTGSWYDVMEKGVAGISTGVDSGEGFGDGSGVGGDAGMREDIVVEIREVEGTGIETGMFLDTGVGEAFGVGMEVRAGLVVELLTGGVGAC